MKKGWSRFMDRRLKERLIGATLLVLLVVLIVPELLSGPKSASLGPPQPPPPEAGSAETVRHLTLDLATRKAVAAADEPVSAAGAGSEGSAPPADPTPEPAATEPPASLPSAVPEPDTDVPDAPPDPSPLKTAATHRGWAVQVGSFASKPNAEKLVRHLRLQFNAVSLTGSGTGHALRYRVRLGPLADRNAALRALAKVKAQGYHASLVGPAG